MAAGQQINLIDELLRDIEPNYKLLEHDLRQLATYLIKVGTNVSIAMRGSKYARQRLSKHQQLNIEQIVRLVNKYKLTWARDCERVRFDSIRNRNLHHIAHQYPHIFIQVAGEMSPGGYEERRFWWCANNYQFYLDNCVRSEKKDKFSTSLLLSDVLSHFLNVNDEKLIAIHALHLSVKHSDSKIYLDWYERNKECILNRIKLNEFGKRQPELREELRAFYRINDIQQNQLATIHVDYFIEWWNLTGLRWPATLAYR